jgi:hypothetical protein
VIYLQPVEQVLQFLRSEFAARFNAYYDGDPDQIPTFNLPAVSVVKYSDQNANGPTGMRRVTETIQIKIIYNKADDWNTQDDQTDLTEKKIRDFVEARDPDTGAYKPGTLKHALMHRFTAEGLTLDDSMLFELGSVVRPADLMTEEGHVTLTLTYLVPNANLSIDSQS